MCGRSSSGSTQCGFATVYGSFRCGSNRTECRRVHFACSLISLGVKHVSYTSGLNLAKRGTSDELSVFDPVCILSLEKWSWNGRQLLMRDVRNCYILLLEWGRLGFSFVGNPHLRGPSEKCLLGIPSIHRFSFNLIPSLARLHHVYSLSVWTSDTPTKRLYVAGVAE